MTEAPLRVAIIIGSTREGRFGPTVGTWFAELARQRDDLAVDVVDVADEPPPAAPGAPPPRRTPPHASELEQPTNP